MIDGLTKENFFDKIKEKYPKAFALFEKWIDDYKKKVNWDNLFGVNKNTDQLHSSRYKFHDLPFELQTGVFNRWYAEYLNGNKAYEDSQFAAMKSLDNMFANIESAQNKR